MKTWIASTYYTEYGTKIGSADKFEDRPPHAVVGDFLLRFQREGHGINMNPVLLPNYIVIIEANEGGVTLQEKRQEDKTLFAEHRFYVDLSEEGN